MAKSITVIRKRGRPATGADPVFTARLPEALVAQVQAWADWQKLNKSEAVRRLLEKALEQEPKPKKRG